MLPDLILASDLPPTTKINALRLAQLAHPDNGHVVIYWAELCDLWQCAQGTARRHLGALHQAGIVHYSTNGDQCAYITFKAISRVGARNVSSESTESARPRAINVEKIDGALTGGAEPDSKSARGNAESARPRAINENPRAINVENVDVYTHAGAGALLVGWLDGSITQTDTVPSNQPAALQPHPAAPLAELTDEQTTAFGLLMEIRMRPDKATEIARSVPLPLIRDAVGAWWMNRKAAGGKLNDQPGVVVAHLLGGKALLPLAPDAWAKDALNLRHRTRAERDADAAAEQEAERTAVAPVSVAPVRPAPEPGTPAAFWQQLQSDFALHQSAGSVDSVIQDSWVIGYEDGVFTVGITDPFRLDWVEKKLRNQIKRRLAVIMRVADVDVRFEVAEEQQP